MVTDFLFARSRGRKGKANQDKVQFSPYLLIHSKRCARTGDKRGGKRRTNVGKLIVKTFELLTSKVIAIQLKLVILLFFSSRR